MVIVVPSVLNLMNSAKDESFLTEAKSIWNFAEEVHQADTMLLGETHMCYDTRNLNMSLDSSKTFKVEMDAETNKPKNIIVVDLKALKKITGTDINHLTVTNGTFAAVSCPAE